jgi:hypothetical protein
MRQRVGIADVAIDDLHALGGECLENMRVEIDHAHLIEHRRIFALQLAQE